MKRGHMVLLSSFVYLKHWLKYLVFEKIVKDIILPIFLEKWVNNFVNGKWEWYIGCPTNIKTWFNFFSSWWYIGNESCKSIQNKEEIKIMFLHHYKTCTLQDISEQNMFYTKNTKTEKWTCYRGDT